MDATGPHAFPDVLLASSVNGGGVFLVVAGAVERISPVDTIGITTEPGGYLWARQAEGVAELRRVRGDALEPVMLDRTSLDLHDIHRHGDLLYVVATATNTVMELDAQTFVEQRRWTMPGERDSQHLNSVCVHEGRILASRFGTFATHRGYKGCTRGAGAVVDLESGAVVVAGLSQPHSLHSVDGRLWLCNSEAHVVHAYRDFVLEHEIPVGGYARGLAFGGESVYVGVSRSRNDTTASGEAAIISLDRATLAPRGRVAFPANEVYELVVVDDGEDLRRAGVRDTFHEVDVIRHARNLFAIQCDQQQARAAALESALRDTEAATAAAEARAAETDAALQDARDRAQEAEIWASLQARAIDALQLHAQQLDADRRAVQAGFVQAREVIAAIDRSRSWRWTRGLRSPASSRASGLLVGGCEAPDVEADAGPRALPAVPTRAEVPIVGLAFAEHAQPLVSIVIAAYGRFAETLGCLQSIQRAGDATSFEVILVEDASGDAEMGRFAHVPGLRYVVNPGNLGYLRSVNAAAAGARGTYLHLLNNDTRVQAGWLDALMSTFALLQQCGLAGSKLVYPDGTLQEAGGIVWSDGSACNYGRGEDPSLPRHAVVREVDYVSGASLLLPTHLFASLGGFDERYLPAYYEDTDLAFRIREAGLRVYVQPGSVVEHHEGLSHGTDVAAGIKAHQPKNREVFRARWRVQLEAGQLAPGEHVFLARDRAQCRRIILVVDRHPPEPDRDAGSRAIWQLMRVLQLHGCVVKFWAEEAGSDPAYADALRRHGIEVFDDAEAGPFGDWMQASGAYLDQVILSRPLVAECYLAAVRQHGHAGVILYGHDIHFRRIGRHAELEDSRELRAQSEHLRRVEHALWSAVDLVLYPSDEETAEVGAYLAALDAPGVARTVPLYAFEGVPALEDRPAAPAVARNLLLFVGGFSHAPNADAVTWFAREVWPRVSARHPHLRLCLAGGGAGDAIRALASETIEVPGFLSEEALASRYRRARVALAPLRFGAGTKGKVIEAMWHGVPCVVTSTGRQGLGDADALRVADAPVDMADAISRFVVDDVAWREASRAGQAYVAARFTVDAVWNVLSGLLDARPAAGSVAARRLQLASADTREDVGPAPADPPAGLSRNADGDHSA